MNQGFGGFPGFGGPGGSAPTFSGEWLHVPSNTKVIVRDNFIEGNDMLVRLQDGRLIDMNTFSRDYVQVSNEEYDINGNALGASQQTSNVQTTAQAPVQPSFDYFAGMEPHEANTPSVGDAESYDDGVYYNENNISMGKETKATKEMDLLEKLFDKVKDEPSIKISIKWDSLPKNELVMLMNYFDVTDEDISKYIFNRYFTKDIIINSINKDIVSTIK